ncbi:MAG: hypothetical protein PUJ12_07840, partial [Oscillospiraceae bacterium]|nr:hypothetical protein [Oscillospiraceae bacterium]
MKKTRILSNLVESLFTPSRRQFPSKHFQPAGRPFARPPQGPHFGLFQCSEGEKSRIAKERKGPLDPFPFGGLHSSFYAKKQGPLTRPLLCIFFILLRRSQSDRNRRSSADRRCTG